MPRPLSNDLRERIIRAVEGGMSRNAAAKKFDVAISSAIKIVSLWQKTGSFEPKRVGGHKKHKLLEHVQKVTTLLEGKPDMTLAEMQDALAREEIKVGQSSILRFLHHRGLTYKKNAARQRAGSR